MRDATMSVKRRVYDALHGADAAAVLYGNLVKRVFSSHLSLGDVVVEGGAFHGGHTLAMLRHVAPLGHVIAFEPSEHATKTLLARAERDDLTYAIDVRQVALADYNGEAEFHRVNEAPGRSGLAWSSAIAERAGDFTVSRSLVPVMRLDDALAGVPRIRMVTLDLEGGELVALRGAGRILSEARPLLLFRNSRARAAELYGYTPEEFCGFFGSAGYELYNILGFRFEARDWTTGRQPNWYLGVPSDDQVSKGTLHGMIDDVVNQHGLSAIFD
ncbi:FkbM family methyltransferase [Roseomonas sp. KE2513]|uniref:FkbM family methyltransferase n=1 Tax=Roseomonas sp. KE2513 TaxID=2479202 RepID=UPI0018DF15A0|nr:FkbM family methyltransferase [Roseomonas sp. KE2513]MBI0534678.1 FkbM family methyltransferase [Roseomonas sp. KE2513]